MSEQPQTTLSSPQESSKQSQVPGFLYPSGDLQMFPIVYPSAMVPPHQDHQNRGAGIYAVPVSPFAGPIAGLPSNYLIPLTYNIPTRPSSDSVAGGDQVHGVQQQQQQQQQAGQQRQVAVRRFQIAFQLDLLLILKLAAVIFLFNQDGSRQRLAVLVLFALVVYLYQTGALAPLVRWLSQSMQRAAAPPRPPRPAGRAENAPLVGRQNENAPLAENPPADGGENPPADGGENPPADGGNPAGENENPAQPDEGVGGNQWWGIIKEIQMIVIGFVTSLLPGFHHID